MYLSTMLWLAGCLSSAEQHSAYREGLKDQDGDGFLSVEAGGDDCDDSDPRVYPGATDRPYDGLDADCAGDDDYDSDSDGYKSLTYGGEDCDDDDLDIHPAALEVCGDGLDNDCDGGMGECGYGGELSSSAARLSWQGDSETDRLGEAVTAGGGGLAWLLGLSGDGVRVGWIGNVASVLAGSEEPQVRLFIDDLSGQNTVTEHAAMVLGDFGGDEDIELAVALETHSVFNTMDTRGVFLFESLAEGMFSEAHALSSSQPLEYYSPAGLGRSGAGKDLVVGGCGAKRAWILANPLELSWLEQGLEIQFEGASEQLGCVVEDAGDLDGDGFHELAVGGGMNEVWVVGGDLLAEGEGSGVLNVADLARRFEFGETTVHFGFSLAGLGDMDGDGLEELGIGAPCNDGLGCQGRVFLVRDDLVDSAFIVDEAPGFGALLVGGRDVTGDGVPDLMAGTPNEQAFLFSGQTYAGTVTVASAIGTVSIPGLGALCLSPDLDENSLAELFVGAPGEPGHEEHGEALLFVAPGM